ncbi:unnamed protein product [Camellia sinensis]
MVNRFIYGFECGVNVSDHARQAGGVGCGSLEIMSRSSTMKRCKSALSDQIYKACCIDVEILSRCLEAKLTVCCCSLSGDKEVIYVDIKYMFSTSSKITSSYKESTSFFGQLKDTFQSQAGKDVILQRCATGNHLGSTFHCAFGGDVRVCDRTALILDIFNQRAATHEAALQVALAQMESGEAIAHNLRTMFGLKVPIISIVIGEGGSGGALAIGCANKLLMLENAVFYVARFAFGARRNRYLLED